jgi:archaellum component FlaF (FlaF/FlaG flagellin family)
MGFSVIAAAAILGVTLFMAVEIITSELLPTLDDVNQSYEDMKDRYQNQLQSNINITTVNQSANGSNFDYTISVQNTGSTTLHTNDFQILINGTVYHFSCAEEKLYPQNTLLFQLKNIPGAGVQRIKVITNNGIADYYTYTG